LWDKNTSGSLQEEVASRRNTMKHQIKKPFDKEGFLILDSWAQFLACGVNFDYFFN